MSTPPVPCASAARPSAVDLVGVPRAAAPAVWLLTAEGHAAVTGLRVEDRLPAVGAQSLDQPFDQRQVHAADHLPVPLRQLVERAVPQPDDVRRRRGTARSLPRQRLHVLPARRRRSAARLRCPSSAPSRPAPQGGPARAAAGPPRPPGPAAAPPARRSAAARSPRTRGPPGRTAWPDARRPARSGPRAAGTSPPAARIRPACPGGRRPAARPMPAVAAASSRLTGPGCRVTTSYRRRRTGSSRVLSDARSGPPGGRLTPGLYH